MDIQVEIDGLQWIAGDCEVTRQCDESLYCWCCLSLDCKHVQAVREYEGGR